MTDAQKGADKAFHPDEHAPAPGPGREPSPEESAGVPDTDTTARTPLGVGESINARGEDVARRGAERAGTKGASQRPYADDTADEPEGVHPQPAVTEGSPDLGTGDQGG